MTTSTVTLTRTAPTNAAAYSAKVFDNLATLCALSASLAYCAADARPDLALLVVAIAGLAWGLRRSARARATAPPNLPPLAVNILVLVAILRAAYHVVRGGATGNAVVSDLSEFLIIIQLIKAFDRRTARDDVQFLALTLFVAIGAILTANSLLVGLLLLVYTPLITGAAMALQIDVGLRRLGAQRGLTRVGADGPGRARHFRTTVGVAVAGALVFAAAAFVLLPRGMGRDSLGAFGRIAPGATVGFQPNIRLGQEGFLNPGDSTPVLDVAVFDHTGVNIGRQLRSLHLRGTVSEVYDRQTRSWRQDDSTSQPMGARAFGSVIDATDLKQVVTVRDSARDQKFLFALWRPSRIEWDPSQSVILTPGSLVFSRVGPRAGGQFRYTVWSSLDAPVEDDAEPIESDAFTSGPIRDQAERILAERKISLDPAKRGPLENRVAASAFQTFLREQATYTLEMEAPPPNVDPIEYFIFQRKKGHCEYFASALVAMCQSVGIPARIAMGYLATEYNEVSGQFIVRASNAHAWAEVGLEPSRWVLFDPSPPADLEQIHAPATGVLARLRRAYEAVDLAWNSLVVSFDEQRRSSLLGGGVDTSWLRERFTSVAPGVDGLFKDAAKRVDDQRRRSAGWIALGVGALTLVGLGFAFRRRLARLLRGAERPLGGADPLAIDLHRRVQSALRHASAPPPAPVPILTHARSMHPQRDALARAAAAAAEAVYASRFGGIALSRDRWRMLVRDLDDAAPAHTAPAAAAPPVGLHRQRTP
jgi:hypothetical protein